MSKVIMIGCDLHDMTTVLQVADGLGEPSRQDFATADRAEMIVWMKRFAAERKVERIVFAYEASGPGFGLYDDLTAAGIECHVLAPTKLPHTSHSRKNKTDPKDAARVLDEVRAHVLAGRKLPAVWVPDLQTRDDTHHPILIGFAALATIGALLGCTLLFRRRKARVKG